MSEQWEYLVVSSVSENDNRRAVDDHLRALLDDYGARGWELVSIMIVDMTPPSLEHRLFFKRAVQKRLMRAAR